MVFHEIDSLPDVVSGHRVIIYYIEDDSDSRLKLRNSVEYVMEMLGKKNDDLIMFKLSKSTQHFRQFKELYKPEISGPIALFVINTEGIPLTCEEINKEDNIYQAFESVCTKCSLNLVSTVEVTKAINRDKERQSGNTSADKLVISNGSKHRPAPQVTKAQSSFESEFPPLDSDCDLSKDSQQSVQATSTELQIRLPDGSKEKQKFDKNALLQEVYDLVHTKFNLTEFDLKTYNHNVFSAEEYGRTLQDLDLIPNGVIIVVCKNVVSFNNNGNISRFLQYGLWTFIGKVAPILQYVQGLLYAFWNSFSFSGNRISRGTQNQAEGSQSSSKNRALNGVKKPTSRFGSNIHTLRQTDDSDDENNRYNGNSTQQK